MIWRILKVNSCMIFAACILSTLISCSRDTTIDPSLPLVDGEEVVVSISTIRRSTKAIAIKDEAEVETLEAIVFDEKNLFLKLVHGKINDDNKSFKFTFNSSEKKRTVCFVANQTLSDGLFNASTTLSNVYQSVVFTDLPNRKLIPMSGQVEFSQIKQGVSDQATVQLMRAVARFDVYDMREDKPNDETNDYFMLLGVQVYRQLESGYTIPNPDNLSGFEVTAPSIPDSEAADKEPAWYLLNPVPKTDWILPIHSEPNVKAFEGIYVPENTARTRMGATTIVIRAKYKGENCYYRINVGDPAQKPFLFKPILRNTKYVFNITKVLGAGYGTIQDALDGEPSNIVFTVLQWTEPVYEYVVFDGLHHFFAEKREITFGRDAQEPIIVAVNSDIPFKEWYVEFMDEVNGVRQEEKITEFDGWVFNNRFDVIHSQDEIMFGVSKDYSDLEDAPRHTDEVILHAGRLRLHFYLEQVDWRSSDSWINWDDRGTYNFNDLRKK